MSQFSSEGTERVIKRASRKGVILLRGSPPVEKSRLLGPTSIPVTEGPRLFQKEVDRTISSLSLPLLLLFLQKDSNCTF